MHPGDDPRIAAGFLDWLSQRGELREETARDVERLSELGAWTMPTADVARPEMPEDERERLVALHLAWKRHAGEIDADWVGKGATEGTDVTWIDASQEAERIPPPGHAPRLLPEGAHPRELPSGPALRGVGQALVVPLLLVAACFGLALAESSSDASLDRTLQAASTRLDAGDRESAERIGRQRALAATLLDLRRRQLELVNRHCESGTWCDDRADSRRQSLRLAERFEASAQSWDLQGESPAADGKAMMPDDLATLHRERARLAAGQPPDDDERPGPTPAEIARRLVLVDDEIALVAEAQP